MMILILLRTIGEVFAEAQELRREMHRRYPFMEF
jgi:hypothetical protein